MDPFVLASDRVRLSVPNEADIPQILAYCQDPDIQKWVPVPSPYLEEHARAFVTEIVPAGWQRGTVLNWAVREARDVRPGDPEPPVLGMCGITLDEANAPGTGSAELGWWVGADVRGRGIAEAAAQLMADYAFDPEGLGLARLIWRAGVGNWPSRRVAWKVGFQVEGTVRGLLVHHGQRMDGWLGTLLPDDPREPNEEWPEGVPVPER